MSKFLKTIGSDAASTQAIILLPDIWGLTNYASHTAEMLSQRYNSPCYILDYFYQLTGQTSNFDPHTDQTTATALMAKLTGEDFIKIFQSAVYEIQKSQLEKLTVIGFCFGGRLAYLAGLSKTVIKIVSFYGAGAHSENYYQGKTPAEALCDARKADANLEVLSFYGTKDESIPAEDQLKTAQEFQNAQIAYTAKQYPTGHAYFQEGRESYDREAAEKSWQDLDVFLKNT